MLLMLSSAGNAIKRLPPWGPTRAQRGMGAPEATAGERGQSASQAAAVPLSERPGNGEHVIVDHHGGTHEYIVALTHHHIKEHALHRDQSQADGSIS